MITSRTGQTLDTGNWIHGCFMVRVGTSFNTYKEVMEYAMQDEIYGTNSTPALEKNVKDILGASGSENGPLPVYFSKRKCRDSSLGGNDAINPLPQFAEDDDISHPHYLTNYGASIGMGQIYSENFDDLQQILYMGFGIPVFSNVGNFWSSAVDLDMAKFVNKGTGITAEKVGYLLGSAPLRIIKIATIPHKFLQSVFDGIQKVPISKYYSFASQMPMYFRFVNTILVMLATNMELMGSNEDLDSTGSDVSSKSAINLLNRGTQGGDDMSGMGTIFRDFGLDMARIMTKRFLYENGDSNIKYRNTDEAMFKASDTNAGEGVAVTQDPNQSTNPTANATNTSGTTPVQDGSSVDESARFWTMSWLDSFKAAYGGAIYDGHLFIGFRVEKGMGATESFSNSTGESQISQVANSKFQEARDASFATMNGKFGESTLGNIMTGLADSVKGLMGGAAAAFKLDPLAAAMTGSAKIDIPEVWLSSNYSRSASFTITCLAPYGDLESIFMSEYVPLACILAGSIPRGTGLSSYSAPFVIQAYCRGIFSSPLCMIESLEVSRGADQFGWSQARLPLKLTMNVTLKDLSPTMYMSMGGDKGIGAAIFGTDDSFGEYMMTLSGMGLQDRISPFRSIRRKAKILLTTAYRNKFSPFMMGMEGGSRFIVSRMVSKVVSGGRNVPNN